MRIRSVRASDTDDLDPCQWVDCDLGAEHEHTLHHIEQRVVVTLRLCSDHLGVVQRRERPLVIRIELGPDLVIVTAASLA